MRVRRVVAAVAALGLLLGLMAVAVPPAEAATCSVPRTQTVRSLDIDFDQCYAEDITAGGQALEVHVFYLESDLTSNTDRCLQGNDDDGNLDQPDDVDLDGVPDRCEHKIANVDNATGDNLLAVSAASETEMALDFYADLGLDAMGGETVMEIFIAEDPGNGGVPAGTRMNLDDEGVDQNNLTYGRAVVFHEMQHLVQRFFNYSGATAFTSEGVARATQDRYDPVLDGLNSWGFLTDANRLLENVVTDGSPDGYRRDTVDNVSYRGMSWWTWFMDTYAAAGDSPPVTGWDALIDYYNELVAQSDQLLALENVIADRGGSLTADFIDYTLALWAHDYSPTDPRLGFDDVEYVIDTDPFAGHTSVGGAPTVQSDSVTINARSSHYYEITPSGACDYATFAFDSPNGAEFGFSAISVEGGVAGDRWTSVDSSWARAVPTDGADRVVGVITGLDETANVDVDWGCAQPTVQVTLPTTNALAYAGLASDPRRFIVRVEVTAGGSPIGGLLPDDFTVRLNLAGGGPDIPATIISGAYTGDDYWLLVQAPGEGAGAATGSIYDATVDLGTASGTSPASVAYLERTLDRLVVLDRSGSMDDVPGKLEAAQNAAMLMVMELVAGDQGGFVSFADTAAVEVGLDEIDDAQRAALEGDIAAATAAGGTSIGAGLVAASDELAAEGVDDHVCTYTVLSDGEENVDPRVADVEDQIADDGCPIDAVAFGPEADEVLMEDLSALVPGGTYDYAPVTGQVPLAPGTPVPAGGIVGGGQVGWENHLGRVYDQALTDTAGRERLLSVAGTGFGGCTTAVATADFSDQTPGTAYSFGDSFESGGVAVSTARFFAGDTSETGTLSITELGGPGAAPPQMRSDSLNAAFDFGLPLCGAQLRFADAGSQTQLEVNGDRRVVDRVDDL
ncbi:MAG: VWA domain-containing protein, partial [Actinomycetota bacterium]|nr:VWA domain-containing protein [Actinomycetota bacterium]